MQIPFFITTKRTMVLMKAARSESFDLHCQVYSGKIDFLVYRFDALEIIRDVRIVESHLLYYRFYIKVHVVN